MHAHTTHAVIYKLYVVENKKFSGDSMCVCKVKRPAHANSTGVIAGDATQTYLVVYLNNNLSSVLCSLLLQGVLPRSN